MFGKSSLTLLSMATVDSLATADVFGNSGKILSFLRTTTEDSLTTAALIG
jgi:hypothetical protein